MRLVTWSMGQKCICPCATVSLECVLKCLSSLSQVDILLESSLLLQYQANPREGHLEQLLHIFEFLKKHPKLTLYLSPESPKMDYGDFRTRREDFAEIYRDADEMLPHQMPQPRGRCITTTAHVDASQAANLNIGGCTVSMFRSETI